MMKPISYMWLISCVLIVPLWNWNEGSHRNYSAPFRFNRTFMELKYKRKRFLKMSTGCFNRTFMELKFTTPSPLSAKEKVLIVPLWNWNYHQIFACYLISGFNRTFMELKYHWSISVPKITAVLIVPLWNWNFVDQLTPDTSILSFNRTFMELKYYL